MPITRKFLDWNRPALPAVAELLAERYRTPHGVDLRNVLVVVPGGRAKRRLLELLADRAGAAHFPPEVITPEGLPEKLYARKRDFAPDFVQHLAWADALRSMPRRELEVVVPRPPADDAFEQWLSLGEIVWSQHRELAADGLDFTHVAERGADVEGFDEHARWQTLRRLQERYLATLDELDLWDRQTARLVAIEHRECTTKRDVVLVATADLNETLRRMLDDVADRVMALVHAPPELAARFDAHGCLVPAAWQEVPIELDDDRLRVVDGPEDQADEVARLLAGYEGRYRADEIAIGVPDESLVPHLERQLGECGVATRWVAGTTIGETAPYRLLEAVAERLDGKRFDTFAALVRHPDLHDWLTRRKCPTDLLIVLDRYYTRRLQAELGEWVEGDADGEVVRQLHAHVTALLSAFDSPGETERPLGDWTDPVTSLLFSVYDGREFDREAPADRAVLAALEKLHEGFVEQAEVPPALAPRTNAATAIRLVLDRVAAALVPPPADDEAIEILGWLELPLDDAEALVVTSFNEGFVPKSVNAHLFLPNALRTRLGILDNDRRYARDAYALSAILASRQRVDLIVGRRDARNDPLAPSRLLFATDPATIAVRVLRCVNRLEHQPSPPIAGSLVAGVERTAIVVPQPQPLAKPFTELSVTAFRTYLACPYRFYLTHELGLEEVDDAAEELDARDFGTVLHEVLATFGTSDLRSATDADPIRNFLRAELDAEVERRYGRGRRAPVNVQIEQMRARLDRFAHWQAEWAAQGWQIAFTEQPERGTTVRFPEKGDTAIQLKGRIDRIDRYRGEDRWTLFDYKTSETASSPEQAHLTSGEWVDLQLPLYRHLVRPLGIAGVIELGYIVLPRKLDDIGARIAKWTDEELTVADEVAAETIRRIRDEVFWPPGSVPDGYYSEFAAICQDGVLERSLAP